MKRVPFKDCCLTMIEDANKFNFLELTVGEDVYRLRSSFYESDMHVESADPECIERHRDIYNGGYVIVESIMERYNLSLQLPEGFEDILVTVLAKDHGGWMMSDPTWLIHADAGHGLFVEKNTESILNNNLCNEYYPEPESRVYPGVIDRVQESDRYLIQHSYQPNSIMHYVLWKEFKDVFRYLLTLPMEYGISYTYSIKEWRMIQKQLVTGLYDKGSIRDLAVIVNSQHKASEIELLC